MYNKSSIKQYIFKAKLIYDLKVQHVSGWFSLKQVTVIGLYNFNNECTEADPLSDRHDSCHFLAIIVNLLDRSVNISVRSVCCFRHSGPQHYHQSFVNLVWYI